MQVLMVIAACASFALGVFSLMNIASDIQLTLGVVGIVGGFVLTGIAAILGRLPVAD